MGHLRNVLAWYRYAQQSNVSDEDTYQVVLEKVDKLRKRPALFERQAYGKNLRKSISRKRIYISIRVCPVLGQNSSASPIDIYLTCVHFDTQQQV